MVFCLGAALLTLACGDSPPRVWSGAQSCMVALPPLGATDEVPPSQRAFEPDVLPTPTGFSLQKLTLGPIGGFSCLAERADATLGSGGGLVRELVIAPFECLAPDGRVYVLTGTGAIDAESSSFFSLTFPVWFGNDPAILVCTTTLRRRAVVVGSDAGPPPLPSFGG